jgi:hypothetical protein
VPLKFLLQWLSSSLSHRTMHYYSFGNPLASSISAFVHQVRTEFRSDPVTVGELWTALVVVAKKYATKKQEDLTKDGLFEDILQQMRVAAGGTGEKQMM